MKKGIILLTIAVGCCLSSCADKETSPIHDKIITADRITGTWLVVSEKRSSDYWTQSDENGIVTDWQIMNPFGSGMPVSSIKFNNGQTFFWNIDKVADWERFVRRWNDLPKEWWSTYNLGNDGNSITLYTRFEYVGIIKIVTTEFQASIVHDDQLILENEYVQLKLSKQENPY
jgi:hypothetical protein